MKCLLSAIFYFSLITGLNSQTTQTVFKHLSTVDGLSNNWVRCIYMGETGFMWFGTADGLNRYDGHGFSVYRPETVKGNKIGNINISGLMAKNFDELWVCTDLGVYIYNYRKDKLLPFEPLNSLAARCVIRDREQMFWFGTNTGLYCLDPLTGELSRYVHHNLDNSSIANDYINALFQDSQGTLWIGTKSGLSAFLAKEKKFRNYNPNGNNSTSDVHSITEDKAGRLWIGDQLNGLFVAALGKPEMNFKKITGGQILEILIDTKNRMWIGKGSGGGLFRIDLNSFSTTRQPLQEYFYKMPEETRSLSDNSIVSIFEDRFNDIWIGTFGSGVNYYSDRVKKFNIISDYSDHGKVINNNLVNAIYEDENRLYIGTEGGLDVYDKKKGYSEHFQNEPDNPFSLASNAVYALYKDTRGNLWVGTWAGGLHCFIPQRKQFIRYMPDGKPGSISSGNIFSILEDTHGYLWIATIGGGLNRFDYNSGTFKAYKNNKRNPKSLYGDMVNHIFQTSSGKIYISVDNSLDQYDYEHDCFIHHVHDVNDTSGNYGNILSVFEDHRKNIWVATNAGLDHFNEKTGRFQTVKGLKLPDNTIQGILEDDHGNLWISTNKGLVKYLNGSSFPAFPVVFAYSAADGLSGDEFKKRSAFKNSQGVMYFGSSKGLTYFHPDSIKQNRIPPRVIFGNFTVLNPRSAENSKYEHIGSNIRYIHSIDLLFKHADFEISFAALNYLNPQNNIFQYKLEGYDDEWIESDHSQSARYTNLNIGKYTFMVRASNNDGIWCNEPEVLQIIIHPPWWRTKLFKIIAVLFSLLLMVAFYWLRFRILRRQKAALESTVLKRTQELTDINILLEQKQEEITNQLDELSRYKNHLEALVEERTSDLMAAKEKAEESDQLKTSFLQNMSHEIRTPLNAIMGFSDLLTDTLDDNEKIVKYSGIIKEKGSDLLNIINEILDISKIESGSLQLYNEDFKLSTLLMEIELFYGEYQKKLKKELIQFSVTNNCTHAIDEIYCDKGKLKQVITNLIGNAFKFTNKGSIELGCSLTEDHTLKFYVADTGSGIPKDKYDVVFERFRQIDEMHFHEGAGLGLSICEGIVHLLGGNIWLTSEVGKGTTFFFTVPLITSP